MNTITNIIAEIRAATKETEYLGLVGFDKTKDILALADAYEALEKRCADLEAECQAWNESTKPAHDMAADALRRCEALEKERNELKATQDKIMRMVDIASTANDAQTEMEVATSATFAESLAHTMLEACEAERDQLKAEVERLSALWRDAGPQP